MCGRYALAKMAENYGEEFEALLTPNIHSLPLDWNVAPTKEIYIITKDAPDNSRILENALWGMIAPWSKDLPSAIKSQSAAINARWESVFEKPTFRSAVLHTRCLIPASGYYEWATELGPYKTKQPFYIKAKPDRSLAFTGIYSTWVDPITKRTMKSASLLTKDSVGFLATVHSRMPLFLPSNLWDEWLNPKNTKREELEEILKSHLDDSLLVGKPVSDRVNSIANNGSSLIEEITLSDPETLF
jgi:putative SOS response-associated peptidase YedK